MNFVLACVLFLGVFVNSISTARIRGCYYTNWSQYRPGVGKFTPKNIEPGLCSHLFFAFSAMDANFKLIPTEINDEDSKGQPGLYSELNAIKQKQPDLKTLLSFGGYSFSQANATLIHKMLDDVKNRKVFIDSVIVFLRRTRFDGFDFNWFPDNSTKENFGKLVLELRESIDVEHKRSGKPKLLLTASIPSNIDRIEAGYDGKNLSKSVDFLNVMTFDYHGPWENKTGFNSPLFDRDGERASVNSTMSYLSREQSIPKEKLVVGFAAYGRGWILQSNSSQDNSSQANSTHGNSTQGNSTHGNSTHGNNSTQSNSTQGNNSSSVGSPADKPSPAQPFTNAEGVAAYFEICHLIEKSNFVSNFDAEQQVPYILKDGVWISYNDVKSYAIELDWLIKEGYGGAFVWAIDMDDFLGRCESSKGKYPLVSQIRLKLK